MERGIFQGCPISPYLFLLVIETMALAVRQNDNIKGIPVEDKELKISLLANPHASLMALKILLTIYLSC